MNNNLGSSSAYQHVAVLGAGAWGTALAAVAARAGRRVTLWSREPEVAYEIRTTGVNATFLPGITLPAVIAASSDIESVRGADALLLASPAQHIRGTGARAATLVASDAPLVLCAKGIERESGKLLTEVLSECAPQAQVAILSGPSFARDVAQEHPTAVTIAAHKDVAFRLAATLGQFTFRPYASEDVTGVALGGAAKNVFAIGTGIVAGMGLGENARAALLSRSFAELCRLGLAMGARLETLTGLSGLGDLVLTATSASSRNYSFGLDLGKGMPIGELLAAGRPLAEGVETAPALVARARRLAIELPIAEAIADILSGKLSLADALPRLMMRPLKAE